MSRGPIPDRDPNRPKVPDVAAMIRQIYASEGGAVGCCLHVLTDDANYDCAAYCAQLATEAGHDLCRRTAEALMQMTPSQTRRAVRRGTEIVRTWTPE